MTCVAEQRSADLRVCPFCAEEIRASAIHCKHCGQDVSPAGQGGARAHRPAGRDRLPAAHPERARRKSSRAFSVYLGVLFVGILLLGGFRQTGPAGGGTAAPNAAAATQTLTQKLPTPLLSDGNRSAAPVAAPPAALISASSKKGRSAMPTETRQLEGFELPPRTFTQQVEQVYRANGGDARVSGSCDRPDFCRYRMTDAVVTVEGENGRTGRILVENLMYSTNDGWLRSLMTIVEAYDPGFTRKRLLSIIRADCDSASMRGSEAVYRFTWKPMQVEIVPQPRGTVVPLVHYGTC